MQIQKRRIVRQSAGKNTCHQPLNFLWFIFFRQNAERKLVKKFYMKNYREIMYGISELSAWDNHQFRPLENFWKIPIKLRWEKTCEITSRKQRTIPEWIWLKQNVSAYIWCSVCCQQIQWKEQKMSKFAIHTKMRITLEIWNKFRFNIE